MIDSRYDCRQAALLNNCRGHPDKVYIVKKLGKNGMWNAVSLIDENGSFRGEAKFETKKEADLYLSRYVKRLKNPASAIVNGEPAIKVFKEDAKRASPTGSSK